MIKFDNNAHASTASGTTLTFAHTVAGVNTCLLVSLAVTDHNPPSVTYGGSALSFLGNTFKGQLWGMLNPPSGNNNIVVACGTPTQYIDVVSASYNGVSQYTVLPDNAGSTNNSGNSISGTLTPTKTNCWLVTGLTQINSPDTPVGGANTTYRDSVSTGITTGILDSNGTIGNIGTINVTFTGSNNESLYFISLAPSADQAVLGKYT